MISRAVAKVELEVEYFLRVWAENDRRAEAERQRERVEAEILTRKKKELNDFKLLLNAAERHDDVKLIRAYLQSKEDAAKRNGTVTEDLQNWIEWARKKPTGMTLILKLTMNYWMRSAGLP